MDIEFGNAQNLNLFLVDLGNKSVISKAAGAKDGQARLTFQPKSIDEKSFKDMRRQYLVVVPGKDAKPAKPGLRTLKLQLNVHNK
jgi:hypothetical protein